MPPKPKFTKEQIVSTALRLVSENGVNSLTARELGNALGSSARPIFTVFSGMDEVRSAVIAAAEKKFAEYSEKTSAYPLRFKSAGMQMLLFAKGEPKLFQLLFMQENSGVKSFDDLFNVLGDFTWTAYDNMGEVGTGRFEWSDNGYIYGITTAEYPWRTCYQGDFDLCGYRRPQSYFREAVWRVDAEPHIFTTHPKHNGDDFSGTGWHWYDVCETWTFEDEYIGVPVKVDVYTTADEIEFALNGKTVGSAKPQKGIATIEIPYEKGELTATSFKDGKKLKSFSLRTTGEEYAVRVVSEKDEIIGDNRDLCYFDISIVDKDGNVVTESKRELKCEVFGGEFMGIFSGDPKNEDSYGSDKCHAFGGRAVAIARCEIGKKLTVRVTSEGLKGGVSNEVKIINGRV